MYRVRIFLLVGLFLAGVGIIYILFLCSEYKSQQPNAFLRQLKPHLITEEHIKNLKQKNLYVAGISGNLIYLGDKAYKNVVHRIDTVAQSDSIIIIRVPKDFSALEDASLTVYKEEFVLFDGLRSVIARSPFYDPVFNAISRVPFFTTGIQISGNSFLFRSLDSNQEHTIVKFDAVTNSIYESAGFLQKQQDGFFSTDGILFNVPGTDKVFYVYYYRNQFIAADTNLQIRYIGKTIDTTIYAKIKIGNIRDKGQTTLANPSNYVNRRASANNQYIFINSALKADNETQAQHDNAAAIDIYNSTNGSYYGSFYLADVGGYKLTDFKVFDHVLIALHGPYLSIARLHF